MTSRTIRPIAICAAAAMLAAACASGETDAQPASSTSASETTAAPASTAAPPFSVTTEDEVVVADETVPEVTGPETERWAALYVNVDAAGEGIVGISRHFEADAFEVFPVEVTVALGGEWASCQLDPASWRGEIAPAEHPRIDAREWSLRLAAAEVDARPDGFGANVRIEYMVISGDDTATLVLTAASLPDCGMTDDSEPSDEGDADADAIEPADTAPETTTESDSEQNSSTTDDDDEDTDADDADTDADDADTDADDADETADESITVEPVTTEPKLFQFRRWDHQALIDLPLWAHCPPEDWGTISDRLDGYDITWAGWDTAAIEIDGRWIAVGYLTDAQIDRWLPGSGITADDALANLHYSETADSTLIWRGSVTLHLMDTPRRLPTLEAAMRSRGVYSDNLVSSLEVTRHGVAGSGAWPSGLRLGRLLTDWVRWRYSWPPTTAEPVAWPLRSLFEARESACAAEALIAMCASDETPPAMLARNHPIGRVLRSLACAE